MHTPPELPFQFSLKTAFWTLGVATVGWRLFTSPINPSVAISIALVAHVTMLVLVSRRSSPEFTARESMILFAWVILCPFVARAVFLAVLYLTGAATEPGPVSGWVLALMFVVSILSLIAFPVALFSLLVVLANYGPAFADDPRYGPPFLAACFGTTMVIVRLYMDMARLP